MKLRLQVTLESDATFGRGDGVAGLVDEEVEHDAETGLPFIRGRTVKGLLVEECANLLYALRGQPAAALRRLDAAAQLLFGQPGSGLGDAARLRVGTALMPPHLRAAVAAQVQRTGARGRPQSVLTPAGVLGSLTAIRRQTAVDAATGAPADGTLRSARVVLRETAFTAELDFLADPNPDALGLLAACVLAVRRGGTARNRGRGRLACRLLDTGGLDVTCTHLTHFDALIAAPASPPASQSCVALPGTPAIDSTTAPVDVTPGAPKAVGTCVLTYEVRLLEPVLATALDGDPNSAVSYDFVPGSVLRGAILGQHARAAGASGMVDATAPEVRELFFNGRVRYLNAYPLDGGGDRALPVPLSWHRRKHGETPVYDFAADDQDVAADLAYDSADGGEQTDDPVTRANAGGDPFAEETDGVAEAGASGTHVTQWEAMGTPFCSIFGEAGAVALRDAGGAAHPSPPGGGRERGEADAEAEVDREADWGEGGWQGEDTWPAGDSSQVAGDEQVLVELVEPERHVAVHVARDRVYGRPRRDGGDIYRYDSLAGGQRFAGAVLCESEAAARTLLALLDGELLLGGSRSGGYGRARLEAAALVSGRWREAGSPDRPPDTDAPLVLTLLSDCLLRDPQTGTFRADQAAATAAFASALGGRLRLQAAYYGTRVVGGFNRTWGLPLAQAVALRMGSVFVFEPPACNAGRLAVLEWTGVGERRAEGFGRVAVNWHGAHETLTPRPAISPTAGTVPVVPANTLDARLAATMARRLLRQQLDPALTARANRVRTAGRPSPSQLSRLQAVLRAALLQEPEAGTKRLKDFLGTVQARQVARRQFARARVAGEPLLTWLAARIDPARQDDVWALLGVDLDDLPQVGGIAPVLDGRLAYEYNLRLAHEVLARAAKAEQAATTAGPGQEG